VTEVGQVLEHAAGGLADLEDAEPEHALPAGRGTGADEHGRAAPAGRPGGALQHHLGRQDDQFERGRIWHLGPLHARIHDQQVSPVG
jgi:hypothetical protein